MAKRTTKRGGAKRGGAKRDVAAEVTTRIVEALEGGVAPWVRPWGSCPLTMPRNAATGREYRGANVLFLWAAAGAAGYADPRWLTFKQALDLGGHVRKGERGTTVVFWKFPKKTEESEEDDGKARGVFCRAYTVFNAEQCDGLDLPGLGGVATVPETAADEVAARAGARVVRGGDRAYYSPDADHVRVPLLEAFDDEAAYASTLLHELTHWTGHETRLDRRFGKRFGDDAYAFEELVAELGAAMLCARLGVEGRLQHAEYVGHWAAILKADKYAVFAAAREAQKALDLLAPGDDVAAADAA